MEYLGRLREAIKQMHGCESVHVSTIPVTERLRGQIVWKGDVELFNLRGHPKATRCYAWPYLDDDQKEQYTAVLELPPITSAHTAVRAAIVSRFKNDNEKT